MKVEPINLRQGVGNGDPRDGLCLMQAVDWFAGSSRLSDKPACASPVLSVLGIRLNDAAPNQEMRNKLWPLVWRLLGSIDGLAEQIRAEHIVREIVHRIVAPVIDGLDSICAQKLRSAHSMSEIKTAAQTTARAIVSKSQEAALAAKELVLAAELMQVRTVSAVGIIGMVGVTLELNSWSELYKIFSEAIELGKYGEEDPIYEPRMVELAKIVEAIE